MRIRSLATIAEVSAEAWDALVPGRDPFLAHAFLSALERHGCVGRGTGWLPCPLVCEGSDGRLLGACPLYFKLNSYGEFVFDGSWAEAYRRHGLPYYPKLVAAVPYTPATGRRLLVARDADAAAVAGALIEGARELARDSGSSSVHWLFPTTEEMGWLRSAGAASRLGCQFHWHNPGYRDFDDFLATLSAKKRKNIRQERRRVQEAGIELECLAGDAVDAGQWRTFHAFYCSTFRRLGGQPTLTLPFFTAVGRALGERVLLVLAHAGARTVGAAISFASDTTLYGRHWGCADSVDALHFEACYYQGIEHCIRRGLTRFEPGAQGEHKVSRGFLPTLTHSAHWIAHPGFRQAIDDFLHRETPAVEDYARELHEHSPYRRAGGES
ncbi:hypothetical protein EV699_12128 [Plasticicumulans lactativorans]|uniref:Uncharacterized protein n=1 Tax=Plasticicumulans lactativorans TaxID=1133106 RepID=A0A4R2LHX8_9GAMM|nr:GNAT family N-acetyltransferase [Plasticicumulans lactativorans]TCO78915.1 hypothetical protein EV699_12128 [Plasticicumulans lactativorans]